MTEIYHLWSLTEGSTLGLFSDKYELRNAVNEFILKHPDHTLTWSIWTVDKLEEQTEWGWAYISMNADKDVLMELGVPVPTLPFWGRNLVDVNY